MTEDIRFPLYKGIFWLTAATDGGKHLLCLKIPCDASGEPSCNADFSSKSDDNFNHKSEWEKLSRKTTRGMPYNYYPRGRVEIKRGKATVYLNPCLNTNIMQKDIINKFGLLVANGIHTVIFKSDGSYHYRSLSDVK